MTRHFGSTLRSLAPATLALAAAVALAVPVAALATPTPYVVTLTQQGGNVVASGSGGFDLSGLTYEGLDENGGAGVIWPGNAETAVGTGNGDLYETSASFAGPSNFGSGGGTSTTSLGTGDLTALVPLADALVVPLDYAAGAVLSGGATWDGATFASLGVTPGIYKWTWGSAADQSFTLDAALPVPEPAEWGIFGIGLVLIGGLVTLRRRQSSAT